MKKLIKHRACETDYALNFSTSTCDYVKDYAICEYLKDFECVKSLTDYVVVTCDRIVDMPEIVVINFNNRKKLVYCCCINLLLVVMVVKYYMKCDLTISRFLSYE